MDSEITVYFLNRVMELPTALTEHIVSLGELNFGGVTENIVISVVFYKLVHDAADFIKMKSSDYFDPVIGHLTEDYQYEEYISDLQSVIPKCLLYDIINTAHPGVIHQIFAHPTVKRIIAQSMLDVFLFGHEYIKHLEEEREKYDPFIELLNQ